MRKVIVAALALATFLGLTATAAAHLEHPAPKFSLGAPVGTGLNSGGPGAAWKLLKTFPTGNPHTDLDFFTKKGEIYASVGTLAVGPNGGGQTIIRLTQGGEVVENPLSPGSPQFVSSHPSAACLSDPTAALGLQHDVEATPKGNTILNTAGSAASRRDAQLLIDATDNEGRCHDSSAGGIDPASPQGGLEIVDITSVAAPVEIGLTSHIGEGHTVNIDPKRPHIAYAVSSDFVSVTCNADDTSCTRANETPGGPQRFNLDGFEVVDLSSCMNFKALTSTIVKRMTCRPQVYRYRYPSALMALGTTQDALAGCHELEIYPNDRLTCASINATMYFDMSGAFDKNGKPKGAPLPCRTRASVSPLPYAKAPELGGVVVTDCVFDGSGQELTIPRWLKLGAPSLTGVKFLGSAFHQGRGGPHPATEDVEVSHEAELSGSRKLIIATDERGGGVLPPGATCTGSPGTATDNKLGNGGLHAYRVDKLLSASPSGPDAAAATTAWSSYAKSPSGSKAIYRANVRTGPQASLCTAHVFQQIPGQNRIFAGWYTQGTQVVDFVERRDGTVEFKEAGWFIPENANTWTSAIFKVKRNANGTYTYWGATGDFSLGASGRSAIDIFKVTLPAPPKPLGWGGHGDESIRPGCEDDDDDDDVEMAMTGPLSVQPGGTAEYRLTYVNRSPFDDAECVEIDDDLPDDLDFSSASDGGTFDPSTRTVSWKVGRLAPGATGTVSLTARVSQFASVGSVIVNQALLSEPGMLPVSAQAQSVVLP